MELQTVLGTIVTTLVVYYIGKWIWFMTFWQRQGVPCIPFISLGWIGKPIHLFFEEMGHRFNSRFFGAYHLSRRILVVKDIELIKQISIKHLPAFAERNSGYFGRSSVVRSLFFAPAQEDWKRIRSIITPAFTSGKLRDMCQPIETIIDKFVENLKREANTGQEFNIKLHFDSMAMDVIARCGYGINVDSLSNPSHPIVANARKILGVDANLEKVVCFLTPALARLLKLEAFDREAINYFDDLTKQIVEKRLSAGNVRKSKDLIGLMIQNSKELADNNNAHEEEDGKLKGITMSEISAQSTLFFIAGYDTTNTTFAHIIYYLAKYPQWQQRLYDEIKANETQLDYEHLKTLKVLNGIIYETLRLDPPLSAIQREAVEDTYVGDSNIFVTKGTIISIHIYTIHRDPEYFPDPLAFKPERFIDADVEASPAFIPFGIGPRLCVGMRFALNELRIGTARFVQEFRVEENPNLELEYFKGSFLQSPKNVMVKLWTRE